MASLVKYDMKCQNEDCNRRYFVVVKPEETDIPNVCPFCGGESVEASGEDQE